MTIKDELLAIQAKSSDGMLRVEDVHKWAKAHPKSELYSSIEWDKDKAALEHQYYQIRKLIVLHITTEDGEPQIVSLTIDRSKPGGGYRRVADVVANRNLSKIMLQDALNELERIQTKYARITELTSVWAAADKIRRRLDKKEGGKAERRVAS